MMTMVEIFKLAAAALEAYMKKYQRIFDRYPNDPEKRATAQAKYRKAKTDADWLYRQIKSWEEG